LDGGVWCSFLLFQTPPMLFNRVHDAQVAGEPAGRRIRALGASTRRSRRRDAAARDDFSPG